MVRDLQTALRVVWAILTGAILVAFVAAATVPAETFAQVLPPCERLTTVGEPCAFCGMTRAFASLSKLRVEEALALNRRSLALYLGLWLNVCVFFVVFIIDRFGTERS